MSYGTPAGQLYTPEQFPSHPFTITTPPTKSPIMKLRVFIPES
jgi:hypothetical protein